MMARMLKMKAEHSVAYLQQLYKVSLSALYDVTKVEKSGKFILWIS